MSYLGSYSLTKQVLGAGITLSNNVRCVENVASSGVVDFFFSLVILA